MQQLSDFLQQPLVLAAQLLLFEIDELSQCHAKNSIRLHCGKRVGVSNAGLFLKSAESFIPERTLQHGGRALIEHQRFFGLGLRSRRANNPDNLVDIGQGQQETLNGMLSLARLRQQELRSTANDDDSVTQELLKQFLEAECPRFAIDESQKND